MDHQQYRLRLKSQPELIKEFYAILSAEKIELPEKAKAILIEIEERMKPYIQKEEELGEIMKKVHDPTEIF